MTQTSKSARAVVAGDKVRIVRRATYEDVSVTANVESVTRITRRDHVVLPGTMNGDLGEVGREIRWLDREGLPGGDIVHPDALVMLAR